MQNDPVDRFAKRGNPAREGSPLPADFADYPFTEQVKTAYLDLVSSRLSASQSLTKGSNLYAYPAGTSFCSCKRKQNTLGGTPRPHAPERPLGKPKGGFPKRGLNGAYKVSATHFYRLPRWSAEWRTTTPVLPLSLQCRTASLARSHCSCRSPRNCRCFRHRRRSNSLPLKGGEPWEQPVNTF